MTGEKREWMDGAKDGQNQYHLSFSSSISILVAFIYTVYTDCVSWRKILWVWYMSEKKEPKKKTFLMVFNGQKRHKKKLKRFNTHKNNMEKNEENRWERWKVKGEKRTRRSHTANIKNRAFVMNWKTNTKHTHTRHIYQETVPWKEETVWREEKKKKKNWERWNKRTNIEWSTATAQHTHRIYHTCNSTRRHTARAYGGEIAPVVAAYWRYTPTTVSKKQKNM